MGIRNQKRNWNRVGIEINFCLFFQFVHEYVDNILEKKIALVSLAIIMVLTGVTFGIGFAFQKRPQLLKGKCETMLSKSKMTVGQSCSLISSRFGKCHF